ncbi:MAG: hypothetical protein HQL69_00010 [Magnetococcales bacterium]|nr:hypothetical protein [Magnetococcales bacterium]
MEQKEIPQEDIGSKLCLGCLLCCKGNICRVVVTTKELHYFTDMDLGLRSQADDKYYFTKSCPQLQHDGCAIYTKHLPNDCSSYQCRTLRPLIKNRIDLTTAQQRVVLVKKQIGEVFAALGIEDQQQANLRDLITVWIKEKQYEKQPEILPKIRDLLIYLDKNFHSQEKLLAKLPAKQKAAGIKIVLGKERESKPQQKAVESIAKRDVEEIILKGQDLKTPAYIVDEITLQDLVSTARLLTKQTNSRLLYSMKANSTVPVLQTVIPLVDGISCSSLLEVLLARQVGGREAKLHFTAPGIGEKEAAAIADECSSISFNSVSQWSRYQWLLEGEIAGGLRVNPHKSLASRPHYDPCRVFSKLGISVNQLQDLWQDSPDKFKNIKGLHVHNAVGDVDFKNLHATSQIIEEKLPDLLQHLQWINLGGGYRLGSCKNRSLFIDTCKHLQSRFGLQVRIEPGTAMVQKACWLLTTVVDMFTSDGKTIAVLDSSINHQLESFIYNFKPNVCGTAKDGRYQYQLAGATCLAGDLLGEERFVKPLRIGSKVLFKSVGAYTHAFSIQYNGLNIPSIYSLQADGRIVLKREFTMADFTRRCGG